VSSKILISPAEPWDVRRLLQGVALNSRLPEQAGADFLILTPRGKIGIQRKTFPDDLTASLEDGRLAREINLLVHDCDHAILIAEGDPSFTTDGYLISAYKSRYTRTGLRNILRSLTHIHGIHVERTSSIADTTQAVLEIRDWFNKDEHRSLLIRPKGKELKNDFGLSNRRDQARYFLQGFPGVGPALAEAIFDHFGKVPLRWQCTQAELQEIQGIGPGRAKALWGALQESRT